MMISDCDSSVLGYIYNIRLSVYAKVTQLQYTHNETDSRLGLLKQYSAEYKIKNERSRLHVSMKLKQNYITGVATGGHGWARAHPTSARVGRELAQIRGVFWSSGGGGGLQTLHEPEGTPYIYTYYEHIICLCSL